MPITVSAGSVILPVVTITSPAANQNFTAPAVVTISANATGTNATISKVEFYNGTTLINTQSGAPYQYAWQNVPAGSYTLKAKATDSKNNSATSPPITINVSANKPSVVSVIPPDGSENVSVNTSIVTNIIKLPNSGINNNTINSSNVYLTDAGVKVPSNVNGTGGGDAIILVPDATLKPNTTYKFQITSEVKDISGTSFEPYASSFTTGSTIEPPSSTVKFTKSDLANAAGQYTNLAIGPDAKLYALTAEGEIRRFVINPDGTLQDPEIIYSLQDSYGTRRKILAVGFAFDPSSTAENLIAWVGHCNTYSFVDNSNWDTKLTRLSGPELQKVEDILIHLPRSTRDHTTLDLAFGPDNALYFSQGSNSGMGMADNIWGNRDENLLTAAILRLDVSKITSLPLDVKTPDGGGTYDPYSVDAPLTIYASGVRNAYDLVWHSNGSLYVPTNGCAAGSNTPASVGGTRRPDGSTYSGPSIPSLTNVQQVQNDFLYRVVKGGYYGHPNPIRGEYVLNGGNPTSGADLAEVPSYPLGTQPDPNWRGNVFNFKNNASPDGAIEYKSNTFNGALKGKLLVVRFSSHDDIIALTIDDNGTGVSSFGDGTSIPGFSGFVDPLSLVEDVETGNLYVAEYGGKRLALLKPDLSSNKVQRVVSAPSYPNPEFVSEDYPNVNSSCDDITATASGRSTFNTNNTVNPFGRIKISPNPAVKKFTIELSKQYAKHFKIRIIDVYGKVYEVQKTNTNGLSVEVDINRLALKPGAYFLKLVSKEGTSEIFKLIVL